jgi:S-formylglutathione hydrolase FrmB
MFFSTIKDRKGRAITGLSMGGHGSLWLSFRHKDLFGAAGSTSGGVDIRPFPQSWGMSNHLGKEAENQSRWDAHTVMTQLDRIQDGDLSLIIDCGTEDFFLEVNRKFHQELLRRGIRHDFIIRPGAHNINYWNNSIDYQWIFFRKYFKGYRDPAASK